MRHGILFEMRAGPNDDVCKKHKQQAHNDTHMHMHRKRKRKRTRKRHTHTAQRRNEQSERREDKTRAEGDLEQAATAEEFSARLVLFRLVSSTAHPQTPVVATLCLCLCRSLSLLSTYMIKFFTPFVPNTNSL